MALTLCTDWEAIPDSDDSCLEWESLEMACTSVYTTVTTSYTPEVTDCVILCDATSGAFAVTLPSASGLGGKYYTFMKIDSSINAITLTGTINGVVNPTLGAQYDVVKIFSNDALWFNVSEYP